MRTRIFLCTVRALFGKSLDETAQYDVDVQCIVSYCTLLYLGMYMVYVSLRFHGISLYYMLYTVVSCILGIQLCVQCRFYFRLQAFRAFVKDVFELPSTKCTRYCIIIIYCATTGTRFRT